MPSFCLHLLIQAILIVISINFTNAFFQNSLKFANPNLISIEPSSLGKNGANPNQLSMVGISPGNLFSKAKEVIDLRDDRATQPTQSMKKAMSKAVVGNVVGGEELGVLAVKAKCTALLNKEAGLFLPSVTMANLVAIMAWCTQRGSEFICGDLSHIHQKEQAGPAQFGGASPKIVRNLEDGTFDLEELEFAIRPNDVAQPVTRLVTLENTHEGCGGKILSPEYTDAVGQLAEKYGLRVHLDGTRLWNAQVALGLEDPSRLCTGVDSVTVSLSHGLGAPAGAILAGPSEFIARARRLRQGLGGQMGQGAQFLAVAGLDAVEKMIPRLAEDHATALTIAKELSQIEGLKVAEREIQTNVVLIYVESSFGLAAAEVHKKLEENGILVALTGPKCLRLMTHYEVSMAEVKKVVDAFTRISRDYFTSEKRYIPGEIESLDMEMEESPNPVIDDSLSVNEDLGIENTESSFEASGSESSLSAEIQSVSSNEANQGESEEVNAHQEKPVVRIRDKMQSKSMNDTIEDSVDFYEMPWGKPRTQSGQTIVDTVVTANHSSSIDELEDKLSAPLQSITAREYEEVQFFGASVSPEGFTVVLTNVNQTLALRLIVTPSDPMSAGVDVSDPESPEALTILQLMQGIDVGSHLPPDALDIKIGLDIQKEPFKLPFVLMTDISDTRFRAKLVVVREQGDMADPEIEACGIHDLSVEQKEFLLEKETGSSFEAVALALRHDAKIYTKSKSLHPSSGLSFDANQIETKYPKIVEATKAARAKFMTDQFNPEAEAGLLKKRLKDAIISGDFEKVQLLQRQLKVYDTAVVNDEPNRD